MTQFTFYRTISLVCTHPLTKETFHAGSILIITITIIIIITLTTIIITIIKRKERR